MNDASFLTITRRDWLIVLLVITLAFAYRAVIIWDRAIAPDNAGRFDPLPEGSDQLTYYKSIFAYHEGTYPPPTFHYQPGISYFLIGLTNVLGTTNLGVIRLAQAALASINCGLLFAVTQLAFGQRRVSIIAALLLALYPVSAFYDTDLVITSQAVVLFTLALLGALWMYRRPQNWIGALLLGGVIGAGAITRLEIAAAGAALTAWLFWTRWQQKRSLLPLGFVIIMVLVFVGPVVLHNVQGGGKAVITPVGPAEIYRGMNRDATGTYSITRADWTTNFDYYHYLWLDFRLEPMRFFELMLHKLGLLFSATEPGNNLGYARTGESISGALRWNPLDFRVLLVLAGFGTAALWKDHRTILLALLAACLGLAGMIMLIWIEARIRTPIIAGIIPCAAYGLHDLAANRLKHEFWQKRMSLLAILIVLIGLSWVAENSLPRPIQIATLPGSAQPVNALYNDELRLVGFDVQEQYSPAGVFKPFYPYVVSLYWMLEQPTSIDYSFAIKLVVDNQAIEQLDHPIGYVSHPHTGTSNWTPNRIYVEHIGLGVERFDVPQEISGHLWLEVYPERDITHILEPVGFGEPPIVLARPAVTLGSGRAFSPALIENDASQPDLHFGDLLVLKAWEIPDNGQPGETVTLNMAWQTTDHQIQDSYILGAYLQNSAGEYVINFDAPPRNGTLLTNAIGTDYALQDNRTLILPEAPDTYKLYIALYRQDNGERLRINGTEETLGLLASIEVE